MEGPKASPGALLGAPWRLLEPSWRPSGTLGDIWGALGAVLEASWDFLGRPWRRLRGVLEAPWAVLEPSWELGSFGSHVGAIWKPKSSHHGAREGPKLGPAGDSNKKREVLKNHVFFSMDFNDF